MGESLFGRVVVPVASRDDAAATAAALAPYIDAPDRTVIAVHVIEKADGALDKASVEQREADAEAMFGIVTEGLDGVDAALETEIRYGTDIAGTLVETADDVAASAIVFTPRGGSRWKQLLSGDVTHNLVHESDVPVVVLPDREVSDA
ncbi:UspA domain protein [Halorhabdus utahensis DSM 12940]|uniref:UspA domain protein n=1 Tax=Halorhabdus utahensis (strain DSM 12940 / JCM 11049 / AX-2) TaxID=519442 RepID=C7NMS5_HALUD|nr:universal stress protein [Halorhabdus utahensis]ACV11388.1 UspA domain protein [Halorhabdus utahensis DSM 12940]